MRSINTDDVIHFKGGGGGSHNGDDAQGGGGAGATCVKTIDLRAAAPGATFAVVIGVGGTGCTGDNNKCGENGKQSRFSTHCIANGKWLLAVSVA